MSAFALLSLLPPDEAPQPLARGRKRLLATSAAGSVDAERRPRARASGSADAGRRPQARASGSAGARQQPQARESGAAGAEGQPPDLLMGVQALLDLLPRSGNSSRTKRNCVHSQKAFPEGQNRTQGKSQE